MNSTEIFNRIAVRFPEAKPKLTEFPSGAAMLDITIGEIRLCAEYLPSHNAYERFKTEVVTPFWYGVEQSFPSREQLESKIIKTINATK